MSGSAGSVHQAGMPAVPTVVISDLALTVYIEKNQRQLDENVHGGLQQLTTSPADGALSSGNPVTFSKGIGKIIFVVNAGSDVAGSITVTGDSVDRNTGAETASDTDVLIVDALTTDDSDTDAEGNTRHAFTGAYITSKWFVGAISVATTNLTITDMDVYHISFEQFNDHSAIELDTFDCSLGVNNVNGWFYAYLYQVLVTAPKVNISRAASLELPAADTIVNALYRVRKGDIEIDIDGSTDGIWVDLFFGPNNQNYFFDVTVKVWAKLTYTLGFP